MTISNDVLTAFGSLAAAAFAAICAYLAQLIRAHFNARQVSTAEQLAGIAVRAAEQMGKAANWDASMKLRSASEDLSSLLAKQGIKLTPDQMRAMIEAAVAILKQANVELTAPPTPVAPPTSADPQPVQPAPAKKGRARAKAPGNAS